MNSASAEPRSPADSPHRLTPAAIARNLHTHRIGRTILVLPEIDSTNSYALDHCAAREGRHADGTAIFAEYQSAGRGRLGRKWESPRGAGLCFTILLWQPEPRPAPTRLIMSVAVALAEAVERAAAIDPRIRWPNDLYVRDKKIAGILIESRPAEDGVFLAIGIGLNCLQHPAHFPQHLADRVTSLEIESAVPIDRAALATIILQRLDHWLADPAVPNDDTVRREWLARSADLNSHIRLQEAGRQYDGTIIDINPDSGLVLQLAHGGIRHFDLTRASRTPHVP